MPAIKFRGVDFIQFDSLLTHEERLVRDTTRQFIEDNLIPIIEECNRAGRFPRELVKPMAELGFFGASLKGYGCAGMSNIEYGLMTQELERGDSGVRSFVSVQSGLCMYPIYEFGSDEQKDQWLPAMQKGEKLGCFGLTEPDFGSNPGGMRTRARKAGNEYVINGEKMPAVQVVLTMLNAGGKFDASNYKVSGGLQGVGVSCVNFLSEYLRLEIWRDGATHEMEFEAGIPVAPLKQTGTTTKRGTKITFRPDSSIFETTDYSFEKLSERLREKAFLNKGIRIFIKDERDEGENRTSFITKAA